MLNKDDISQEKPIAHGDNRENHDDQYQKNKRFPLINLDHFRQDVARIREENIERAWYRCAAELIPQPNNSNKQRIIELGGGRAEFARYLREEGYEVIFTDISENNVKNARDLGFEAHVTDLNHGLPEFLEGSFDGAVLLEVIEHTVKAEFLLREVNRVLVKDGFLVVSTPNVLFFKRRLQMLRGHFLKDEGYHYRFFTKKKLDRIIRESGFQIEERNPVSSTLGINKLRTFLGLKPIQLKPLKPPEWLEALLAKTFLIRARKVDKFQSSV